MNDTAAMSRLDRRVAGVALAFLIGLGLGIGAASTQHRTITVSGAWLTPEPAALADRNVGSGCRTATAGSTGTAACGAWSTGRGSAG